MRISPAELSSLKTLVYAQRSIALLGSFPEQSNLKKRLKQAKKLWWSKLRQTYHLPTDTKFAIELSGDLAGELRIKGSGGVPYTTYEDLREAEDALPPVRPIVDVNELTHSLNAVLSDLGATARQGY